MPGWQRLFEPLWKKGKIALAGVVQEQHAERARLYAQWRGIEWPILVDSMNLYGLKVVPIPMGLDEHGRVVVERIRSKDDLDTLLAAKGEALARKPYEYEPGVRAALDGRLDEAVAKLRDRKDAPGIFRLGVALRARAESASRRPGDAQGAVEAWQRALSLDPNQYIWRRRIQQYGPRLAKPYNFYGWVEQARAEIRARGEEPAKLRVEPRGAEILARQGAEPANMVDKDPAGKIARDKNDRVEVETIVTPPVVRPGDRVRVRFVFRPKGAAWNDEGEPLTVWVENGVAESAAATAAGARIVECELQAGAESARVRAYALYDVCIDDEGTCVYLRKDLVVPIRVDEKAVSIR